MDNAPNYDPSNYNLSYGPPSYELDEWLEISNGNKKNETELPKQKTA